jgi:uroporphyrinogen III methyltransferase / synthase
MRNTIKILSGSGNPPEIRVNQIMSDIPEIDFELVQLKATAGLFKREIYQALLNNEGDIAILPATRLTLPLPMGLTVFALIVTSEKTGHFTGSGPLEGYLAIAGRMNDIHLYELFRETDAREHFGRVTIIGFGPGDREYLTVKGRKALKKADIIFHDDLIDKNYLSGFSCEKVFVGKRKGKHSKEQEEINRLLYDAAVSGKNVVRLKGGDPSIFGRMGEEVQFLRERLIHVGIIPGITSASAASAIIGTPLTQRGISKSIAFCSGDVVKSIRIPDAELLVFFMAASNLHKISQRLIEEGWDPCTSVAIVSKISMPGQTIRIETLEEVSSENIIITPAIIIVGKIINKDFVFQYLNQKPKVLVTCSDTEKYEKYGQVIHSPVISVKPLDTGNKYIDAIGMYDYLIFNSRESVTYFFKNLLDSGKDSRNLNKIMIVSSGASTTRKLRKFGIVPDIEPADGSREGIADHFTESKITHKKILMPGPDPGSEILAKRLLEAENQVDIYSLYSNGLPDNIYRADLSTVDYITFSSPLGVEKFYEIYGTIPSHIHPVVNGKETRDKIRELGLIQG